MGEFKCLTNQRFGRLLVIGRAENNGHHTRWNCICDCGKETISHTTSLTSGRTKSCGCLGLENATKSKIKHGGTKTELYKHWCNMKRRCNGINNDNYKYYGGRGISVCKEWNYFVNFKDWATANDYKNGLTIERINVNGNYESNNCKWITQKEQIRNRTNTVKLQYCGETKCLIEWCEKYDINYKLAHARYKRGWSFERIFDL